MLATKIASLLPAIPGLLIPDPEMNSMTQDLLPPVDQEAEQGFDPYLLRMLGLDRTARALDLEDTVLEQMRHAELEATIRLPGARSDGSAAGLSALACLYAPAAGSILELAIGPDTHLNQVRASAFLNDLSCALLGLGWRGGAAGLILDSSQYPERETRRLLRRWCEALQRTVPGGCALSSVHGGNRAIQGWLGQDLRQFTSPSGAAARQAETQPERRGRWIAELVRAFAGDVEVRTCAIQGAAGLGMAVARALSTGVSRRKAGAASRLPEALLASGGVQVVMMSDSSGAVRNQEGMELGRLEAHLTHEQVLFGYPGGEHARSDDLPGCECDLLVLQSPMQITTRNADQVRARLVVECVPDCVSQDAKTRLAASGVEIVPELLVRCGPILLAAAESQAYLMRESRVGALLRQRAVQLRDEIAERALAWKTTLSHAALMLAIERRAAQLRRAGL